MKAKRFVSAVSALAITASVMSTCVSVSAAGENVILKGQQIESKAGAEFSLDINLAELSGEAIQGFSGCEFAIEYDPAKISIDSIVEGATLKTGATDAELDKAPGIGDEVTMVNKGNYNCFDYNIVERSGKNVIAVLWCTGLDSSKYWASKEGTMLTLNGTVYADAKEGEEIPVIHVHTSKGGWLTDGDTHWKECDDCGDKYEISTHTYEDGECTVCEEEDPDIEKAPATGDSMAFCIWALVMTFSLCGIIRIAEYKRRAHR